MNQIDRFPMLMLNEIIVGGWSRGSCGHFSQVHEIDDYHVIKFTTDEMYMEYIRSINAKYPNAVCTPKIIKDFGVIGKLPDSDVKIFALVLPKYFKTPIEVDENHDGFKREILDLINTSYNMIDISKKAAIGVLDEAKVKLSKHEVNLNSIQFLHTLMYIKDMKDKFSDEIQLDMHFGNFMVDDKNNFIITDPVMSVEAYYAIQDAGRVGRSKMLQNLFYDKMIEISEYTKVINEPTLFDKFAMKSRDNGIVSAKVEYKVERSEKFESVVERLKTEMTEGKQDSGLFYSYSHNTLDVFNHAFRVMPHLQSKRDLFKEIKDRVNEKNRKGRLYNRHSILSKVVQDVLQDGLKRAEAEGSIKRSKHKVNLQVIKNRATIQTNEFFIVEPFNFEVLS